MKNKFTIRLQVLFSVIVLLTTGSCKKHSKVPGLPTAPASMEYFNLNNREIKSNAPGFSIDVNYDGRKDLAFTTLLVGDPINQVDKLRFLVSSNIDVNLPVNANEEIPVMSKGESIVPVNFNGYQWVELATIILVQKTISLAEPPLWDGHWKNAEHKYLPFQVFVNSKVYNGWVELSVDIAGEKIILHKAALSKEPDKIVKAGE